MANAPLFESVREFLELIKSEKIPLAVVTDLTSHIQLRKLTYFNLQDTFDAVVCSEEVGIDKPNKANFDLALRKLNLQNSVNFREFEKQNSDLMKFKYIFDFYDKKILFSDEARLNYQRI